MAAGGSASVTVTLPGAGATEFVCRFHSGRGMVGAYHFSKGDKVTDATG